MNPLFTLVANKIIDKHGSAYSLKIASFFILVGSIMRCFIN